MIPTRTIAVAPYTPGVDTHGAPTEAWGVPVPVRVYGWAPADMSQPIEANRRPVESTVRVYAPQRLGGPRARWHLPEGEFEQIGHAMGYDNGPWWPAAGAVIQLRRVEG